MRSNVKYTDQEKKRKIHYKHFIHFYLKIKRILFLSKIDIKQPIQK